MAPRGNKNAVGNKGGTGRPPIEFKEKHVKQVKQGARIGLTEEELAELLGIGLTVFGEWKQKYPEFSEALKIGKRMHDTGEVENSLLKRAKGFTRMVERATKDGPMQCLEEVPPDTTACIFWLKNRQPKDWRDKQEIEQSGGITVNFNTPIALGNKS